MTPEDQLVEQLGSKTERLHAMRALIGGANARELRSVQVTDAAFEALARGLRNTSAPIRFWCLQLLDHCPETRALDAVAPLLRDPVPRVRRMAVHALRCDACKPAWSGVLADEVLAALATMAASDPNVKVRAEATLAVASRTSAAP